MAHVVLCETNMCMHWGVSELAVGVGQFATMRMRQLVVAHAIGSHSLRCVFVKPGDAAMSALSIGAPALRIPPSGDMPNTRAQHQH